MVAKGRKGKGGGRGRGGGKPKKKTPRRNRKGFREQQEAKRGLGPTLPPNYVRRPTIIPENVSDDEDEIDEQANVVSAYDKLLASLRNDADHGALFTKLQTEGLEEDDDDDEDDEEEEEEIEDEDGEELEEGEEEEEGEDDEEGDDEDQLDGEEGEEGEVDEEGEGEELEAEGEEEGEEEDAEVNVEDMEEADSDDEQDGDEDGEEGVNHGNYSRLRFHVDFSTRDVAAAEALISSPWRPNVATLNTGPDRGKVPLAGRLATRAEALVTNKKNGPSLCGALAARWRELTEAKENDAEDEDDEDAPPSKRQRGQAAAAAGKKNGKKNDAKAEKKSGKKRGKGEEAEEKEEKEKADEDNEAGMRPRFATPLQNALWHVAGSFVDLLYTMRTPETADAIRDVAMLHAMNHVIRCRRKVVKNNRRVRVADAQGHDPSDVADQGFTRPKVLFLLPFRSSAYKYMHTLMKLLPKRLAVAHKERFENDYGDEEGEDEAFAKKPLDYQETFGGNTDDCFCIGMCFNVHDVRLFCPPLIADIVFASPVSLAMMLTEHRSKLDFLSSVEILIVDQADTILMQNWDHCVNVVDVINEIPKKASSADVRRLRDWAVDGHAKFFRQTMIFSSIANPDINHFYSFQCRNYWGQLKTCEVQPGILPHVAVQVQQVFQRLPATKSLKEAEDARYDYFINTVLARMIQQEQSHTLIFVRSYLDFVRIRNYCHTEKLGYAFCSEYSEDSDLVRARSRFFHGQRVGLIYTERLLYYKRPKVRGATNIIFYSLPEHPIFYSEIVNQIADGINGKVLVLYDRFDALALQRVVGSSRASSMMESVKAVHLFC